MIFLYYQPLCDVLAFPQGFLFSGKMMPLDFFDMYLVIFDRNSRYLSRFSQYLVKFSQFSQYFDYSTFLSSPGCVPSFIHSFIRSFIQRGCNTR